ncbi:MAG: hypothetical protein P8P28_03000 [Polaribacter sp.]|jgi:hypothetical protein|nr:hypothetical protein [Polaribacter sp.]MDG1320979.1 hypothetical protein [Polaribacter sp.]
MKKTFFSSLLLLFIFQTSNAQKSTSISSENSFIEWNVGIAFIADENFPFPGTSVLWGKTHVNENDIIFEYQAGFAFPSLITGKIGVGKMFGSTKVIAGIRPFPFNVFLQSSFAARKNGYWIASAELNPLNAKNNISFESKAIVNVGYRWSLNVKK